MPNIITPKQIDLLTREAATGTPRQVIDTARTLHANPDALIRAALQRGSGQAPDALIKAAAVTSGMSLAQGALSSSVIADVMQAGTRFARLDAARSPIDVRSGEVQASLQYLAVAKAIEAAKASAQRYSALFARSLTETVQKKELSDLSAERDDAQAALVAAVVAQPDRAIGQLRAAASDPTTARPAGWLAAALMAASTSFDAETRKGLELTRSIFEALALPADLLTATSAQDLWTGFSGASPQAWLARVAAWAHDIPNAGTLIWDNVEAHMSRWVNPTLGRDCRDGPLRRVEVLGNLHNAFPHDKIVALQLQLEVERQKSWFAETEQPSLRAQSYRADADTHNIRFNAAVKACSSVASFTEDEGLRKSINDLRDVAMRYAADCGASQWTPALQQVGTPPAIDPKALAALRADDTDLARTLAAAIDSSTPVTWTGGGVQVFTGRVVGLRQEEAGELSFRCDGDGARVGWSRVNNRVSAVLESAQPSSSG